MFVIDLPTFIWLLTGHHYLVPKFLRYRADMISLCFLSGLYLVTIRSLWFPVHSTSPIAFISFYSLLWLISHPFLKSWNTSPGACRCHDQSSANHSYPWPFCHTFPSPTCSKIWVSPEDTVSPSLLTQWLSSLIPLLLLLNLKITVGAFLTFHLCF